MYGEEPFGPGYVMTHLLHPMLCTLWEQEAEPGIAGDVEHGREKSSPSLVWVGEWTN